MADWPKHQLERADKVRIESDGHVWEMDGPTFVACLEAGGWRGDFLDRMTAASGTGEGGVMTQLSDEDRCKIDGHCYHPTSTLTVNPPITVETCCWCGVTRQRQYFTNPTEHGTHVLVPRG